MKGIKFTTYYTIAITIVLFCTSCSVNKHLAEDDYLVTQTQIILEDTEEAVKEKAQLKYELSQLITQDPNNKFLFFFRPELHWYFSTKPVTDETSKLHKFFRRKFTEPPVLYKREKMEETAVSMENFLMNKGFFDAKVFPSNTLKKRKKAEITYEVYPGNLYKLDTLIYESKDPTLDSLKGWFSSETLLSSGQPIDLNLYNEEVNRVTDSLRNNGYAFFFPANIEPLETDTTGVGYDLTVYNELTKPYNEQRHRTYRIGKINIYPNFRGELGVAHRDTLISGLHFKTLDGDIGIKPKLIRKNIYIYEGDLFNQSLITETNKQLNALGIYKFVNIRTNPSTTEDGKIDVNIVLSKQQKQNITLDADINNSERFLTNQRNIFFGNSLNISYLNRNAFNGAERFSISLEEGVEFNLSTPDTLINSLEFTGRLELRLPEFVDVPGTWKILSLLKIGDKSLFNKKFLKDMRKNGIPTGSFSYNSFNLRNFYSYNSITAALKYDLKRSATEKYTITTTGLTVFQSETEPAFNAILRNNPLLAERLGARLISGVFYSELNFLKTTPQSNLGETWQFRFNHELSGAEALLANFIFKGNNTSFNLPGDLEFAHFNKLDADVRYFKEFKNGNVLGLRAAVGAAFPFSKFSNTIPYVKQFFVGGPNSLRAWQIRELGPGEYEDQVRANTFFQTGDFKIEFNAEYRFKFIPFLNMDGAIFLDGGNIWDLREDASRPGSQLLWRARENADGILVGDNFIDQIALGTGFGLRIDFTYFVLTVDVGLKLLSPFELDNGTRWYFDDYTNGNFFNRVVNPNLLFGYPF